MKKCFFCGEIIKGKSHDEHVFPNAFLGRHALKNEKITIKLKDMEKKIEELLDKIQSDMYKKAKDFLNYNIVEVKDFDEFLTAIKTKKFAKAKFCGQSTCEDSIKDRAEGATCRCIPFEQKPADGNCVQCGNKAKSWAVFGKGY